MTVIHAIFENGVFRPTEPVNLPENSLAEVHVPDAQTPEARARQAQAQKGILEILSRSYPTGQTDTAARHDEHQP